MRLMRLTRGRDQLVLERQRRGDRRGLRRTGRGPREPTRQGHDVLVLEGRDRVGGRSFTGSVAGLPADMGGTFVGPTEYAVLGLAAELDIATTPTYNDGKNLIQWRGWARPYRGAIPRLSLTSLLDVGRLRWQFERIARSVPWPRPGMHGTRASSTTSRSATGDRLDARHRRGARLDGDHGPGDVGMRTRRGFDAARRTLRTRGRRAGTRWLDVENGAQQDHFPGGTQQIAEAAAAELSPRVVLSAPVRRIDRHGGGVTITSDRGQAEAGFVIVAIPPAHRTSIEFVPPLPPAYDQLAKHWPQGRRERPTPAYSTPFYGGQRVLRSTHFPTKARYSSPSTSARKTTGRAS